MLSKLGALESCQSSFDSLVESRPRDHSRRVYWQDDFEYQRPCERENIVFKNNQMEAF